MKRVVVIRHTDDPFDDRVATYLRDAGIAADVRRPFKGDALGDIDDAVGASVVCGGPFAVFEEDQYPFLRDENRWIEQSLARNIPILGICQGAQSLARVLGADVGPKPGEPCEFGYYPVTPTDAGREFFPDNLVVTQFHSHEFQLPAGAILLAQSDMFERQAFRYGDTAFGFQFHAEVTPTVFRRWQEAPWALYGAPGAQSRPEQDRLMQIHDSSQHRWFTAFLQRFFQEIAGLARVSRRA